MRTLVGYVLYKVHCSRARAYAFPRVGVCKEPAPGFADLRALHSFVPLCPFFGFSRGTPIDRYYLDQFVQGVRSEVVGRVLEIGGTQSSRLQHGFLQAAQYVTVDCDPNTHPDVLADVHQRATFSNGSFDSVIAFNVLEHCERPWDVVSNINVWLARGGRFFCMVPSSQRTHAMPNDYSVGGAV